MPENAAVGALRNFIVADCITSSLDTVARLHNFSPSNPRRASPERKNDGLRGQGESSL